VLIDWVLLGAASATPAWVKPAQCARTVRQERMPERCLGIKACRPCLARVNNSERERSQGKHGRAVVRSCPAGAGVWKEPGTGPGWYSAKALSSRFAPSPYLRLTQTPNHSMLPMGSKQAPGSYRSQAPIADPLPPSDSSV
jgi:hypothetical protein